MHFGTVTVDTNTLILIGVAAHLLGAAARAIWKTPKRQAQIDSIEAKVDGVLARLTPGTAGKDGG